MSNTGGGGGGGGAPVKSISIYGNWRGGVTTMGGIMCLCDLVSTPRNMLFVSLNSALLFCIL